MKALCDVPMNTLPLYGILAHEISRLMVMEYTSLPTVSRDQMEVEYLTLLGRTKTAVVMEEGNESMILLFNLVSKVIGYTV